MEYVFIQGKRVLLVTAINNDPWSRAAFTYDHFDIDS